MSDRVFPIRGAVRMSQKRIQNRDASEMRTHSSDNCGHEETTGNSEPQHSSDMVEQIADGIAGAAILTRGERRRIAIAALEASHHAELVEYVKGSADGGCFTAQALLAKIGGSDNRQNPSSQESR